MNKQIWTKGKPPIGWWTTRLISSHKVVIDLYWNGHAWLASPDSPWQFGRYGYHTFSPSREYTAIESKP